MSSDENATGLTVRTLKLDGKEYLTVPDALRVIRQRFPDFTATNLYEATGRLDKDNNVILRSIVYTPPTGGFARRLIEVESFREYVSRPGFGSHSHSYGKRKRSTRRRR